VVRLARPADGIEQDSVIAPQPVDAVRGHHRPLVEVPLTRPVELVDLEVDARRP
jgi:hypothetical protein